MREQVWFKSSYSAPHGACVEVRQDGGTVAVRDSKNPSAGPLLFTRAEWRAFIDGARDGEFDL